MLKCIACESRDTKVAEVFSTDDFFKGFAYEFNIKREELKHISDNVEKKYEIIHCNTCGLEYADPRIGGNSNFYEVIYQYLPRTGIRWEFGEFRKDFSVKGKILDIGCGDGSFVKYANGLGFKARGIDFNPSRIEIAKNSDAAVENINIDEMASYLSLNRDYDIYTLWHVLEHVENPLETLTILHNNSKNGSSLVVSVPSERFYAAHRSPMPIMNYPPHHLTRWTIPALKHIGEKSGWKLELYKREPLDGAMKVYGERLFKSILLNRNLIEELRLVITKKRFSGKALSPRNDHFINNIFVKIMGRILARFLMLEKGSFSGMSLYVKYGRQ
ncbi:MAG: class I SAM-dependent methyltransferase [Candidatus Margulisiibacteriota bacterium]